MRVDGGCTGNPVDLVRDQEARTGTTEAMIRRSMGVWPCAVGLLGDRTCRDRWRSSPTPGAAKTSSSV
ncbi:hypothetical protein ACFVUN_07225 [Kitasatospora griseola]|uniref:hypothetical protein n=1 Tax=Kitasatospora griseola TaxID=2064 RepID=UPI0036D84809